jgi:hypothetical protein
VERFLTCKRVRQPAGLPEEVRGHDFVLPAWRRVSPDCKNVLAHRTPLTAALERLRRDWDNLSIDIAQRTQLACSGLPPPGTASLSAYEHHLGHYPLGNICRQGSCTAFDSLSGERMRTLDTWRKFAILAAESAIRVSEQ